MFFYRKTRPTSPGKRHRLLLKRDLAKKIYLKFLATGFKRKLGKNNTGRITVRHRGGGVKKKYRLVNFFGLLDSKFVICSIEYDPFRSCFIAAVFDTENKVFDYILAAGGLKVGDIFETGSTANIGLGAIVPLYMVPNTLIVFNIPPKAGEKAQFSRSAGTFSEIVNVDSNKVLLKLSSSETKIVSSKVYATLGAASNDTHFLRQLGKAGCSRWLGVRPTVRGVAMNPVDHPNGGGEGKQSGKAKNLWGKPSKQKKKTL